MTAPAQYVPICYFVQWDGTNDSDIISLVGALDGATASVSADAVKSLTITNRFGVSWTVPVGIWIECVLSGGVYVFSGNVPLADSDFKAAYAPANVWP